jgi:NADH:ubiquinone oxidoreductase subunit F (NADH-binding)
VKPLHVLLPAAPLADVDEFLTAGGGRGIEAARRLGPAGTIDEVLAAGVRGRGGAGFPAARKWQSVRDGGSGTRYVVANGAEGEPATFKDRMLMRRDPYRILEGAAIAALAVGATDVFVATKRHYVEAAANLRRAAVDLQQVGVLDDVNVTIVEGPDEYLFGEEKALLEVVEGRDPLPRLLPPWQHGLFATAPSGGWEAEAAGVRGDGTNNPTVVNNVETLAAVAHVLANGADWYRSMGTDDSPGTVLVTVVGDVVRAGVVEVEFGTPLSDVLAWFGGPRPGHRFRAAFSGVSNPVLPAAAFDLPLSYEGFAEAGTALGAAGFVIYDDTTNLVSVARELARFLAVESCGQCPPCKNGALDITAQLEEIEHGIASDAAFGVLNARLLSVTDANRCYLGTEVQNIVASTLRAFPEDFVNALDGGVGAPPIGGSVIGVPLIEDITEDGEVTYDQRHARKRPDWTYAD